MSKGANRQQWDQECYSRGDSQEGKRFHRVRGNWRHKPAPVV
jgi:hypothetical protein